MHKRAGPVLLTKRAEDENLRLREALRQSEKRGLAGRVTASVVHEINNPAEAIGNLIYLLKLQAEDPQEVRALAAMMEEQLARIRHVSRQTLSYFRDAPQKQQTDVVALVATTLRFYRSAIDHKQIIVRSDLPEVLMASLYPGDFLQMISNLVSNAIDAMRPGGMLSIRLRSHSGVFRLTIADNGCGIPAGVREHVFEAFHSTKKEAGNGLGLWICWAIAERHGGHLRWRSSAAENFHGTTFSFSLAS